MATSPEAPALSSPKRFALELPIEFRAQHDHRWWPGKTENISANGMLFTARKRVLPLSPIQITLQLPAALTGDGAVRLLCFGYVVRALDPQPPSDEFRVAATLFDYRLVNGKSGPAADLRQAQLLASRGDVATLAHRLTTLLCVIMGNAELLLLDAADAARVRQACIRTRQATQEAATLLGSLVTMAPSASDPGFHPLEEWDVE